MEVLNNLEDVEKYKNFGELTQPFLTKEFLHEKILIDLKHKQKDENSDYYLESLFLWINANVTYSKDEKIQKQKFMRTAKEIWESKQTSGCTDYALLFATFARTLGIPTTYLHTAEYSWFQELKNKGNTLFHSGHSFCECYFNGRWILVDPTSRRIQEKYEVNKIILTYSICGHNVYIPYFRDLDLGKKLTIKEHNKMMDEFCKELEV